MRMGLNDVSVGEEYHGEDVAYNNLEKIIEDIFKAIYPNEDIEDYEEIYELDELLNPIETIKNIDSFKEIVKKKLYVLNKEKEERRKKLSEENVKLDSDNQIYYSSLKEVYKNFSWFNH